MVGAAGFELATLCSQSRCATRLRYAPTADILTLKQPVLDAGDKKVTPEMHLCAFFYPTFPPRGVVAAKAPGKREEKAAKSGAEVQAPRVMGI
jgi:hypothetical protein